MALKTKKYLYDVIDSDVSSKVTSSSKSGSTYAGSVVTWEQFYDEGENIADITINGVTQNVYAPEGGSGGSTVVVTPTVTSGTKLADISVDSLLTSIYAPSVSAAASLASGTTIGTVTVGGNTTTFKAPTPTSVSVTQKTSTGTNIADITINGTTTQLWAPTSGGGGVSSVVVTPTVTSGTNIATINVDGTSTTIKAPTIPTITASQIATSGTNIGKISINGTETVFKAPTTSVTTHVTSGTHIADITSNGTTTALYAPTSGGGGSTTWGNISGTLSNQTDLNSALAGKAASSHTHSIANVTNLQSTLDGKAASSHTHSIANVTNLQSTLDGKAASSHTHSIANVTNLQSTLDSKSGIYHTHLTIPGVTVPNILWGDCVLGGDKRWASAILRRLINGTWYFFLIIPSSSSGTGMVLQYDCSTGDLANTYSSVYNLEHANSVCYNPVNDRYYVLQCSTQSTGNPNLNVSVYDSSWTYLEVFTLPGTAGETWHQFISFDPVTNKLWAGHIPNSRVYEISYNSTTSKTAITQHTVAGSPNYPYRCHDQDTAVFNNTFYTWDCLGNLFVGDITYSGTSATWTTRSTGAFNNTDIEGVYYLGEAEGGEFDSVGRLFIARCSSLFQGRGYEQTGRASGKYAAQTHNMFCEVPTHNSVYKDWYRYTSDKKLDFCGSDDYYVNLVDQTANMKCNAWTVKHPNICNQFRMKPTEIRTATVDVTITGWETNFSFDLILGKTLTLGSPMVLRGGNVGIRRYYGNLDGYSLTKASDAPGILTSVDSIAMPIIEAYGGARVTIGEWLPPVVPKNLGLSGYWGGSPEFIIDSMPANTSTYFKVRDGNSTGWTNVAGKGIYVGKERRVSWS